MEPAAGDQVFKHMSHHLPNPPHHVLLDTIVLLSLSVSLTFLYFMCKICSIYPLVTDFLVIEIMFFSSSMLLGMAGFTLLRMLNILLPQFTYSLSIPHWQLLSCYHILVVMKKVAVSQ